MTMFPCLCICWSVLGVGALVGLGLANRRAARSEGLGWRTERRAVASLKQYLRRREWNTEALLRSDFLRLTKYS